MRLLRTAVLVENEEQIPDEYTSAEVEEMFVAGLAGTQELFAHEDHVSASFEIVEVPD